MRERAHVAAALHVVLSAQRVHADALAADVAGDHREVRDRHHGRAALAVLGDAEAVVDRRVGRAREQARCAANVRRGHAGLVLQRLGRVLGPLDELLPLRVFADVAALRDVVLLGEAFGHDDVRERVEHRDVRAWLELQVEVRFDVRRAHEVDAARVDDDEAGAFFGRGAAQTSLHARREHRVPVGRVGADDDDAVGVVDAVEVLRSRGLAERLLQAIARRRMAHARARVDVVGAERSADQLLHEEGLLVGAARARDAADRVLAVLLLDAADLAGGVGKGLVPAHFLPRVRDLAADHRLLQPVLVRRVAPREAALHAAVSVVRLAVLVGHHANDFAALHLGAERAADAAIRARRDDGVVGLALLDDRLLGQRCGGASLHARAARHAFTRQEVRRARSDLAVEAAAFDRQRERALDLLARAHAARADDALARVEREVGVGLVLLRVEVVLAVVAVAHFAQADDAGHVLQLTVAVGGAREAVERMVADVELHHTASQVRELLALRRDLHARLARRRA